MPAFIYKGIPEKKQKELLAKYMETVKPQDKRCAPPLYHIDAKDSEETREIKRERKKKYMAEREAEYKKELKGMDEKVEMMDKLGNKVVFEKGKAVEIPETSSLIAKLNSLVDAGVNSPCPYWERSEKKERAHFEKEEKKV